MANAKKVGTLIKKARTEAGLTQEQLAKKVTGASAADIGKAERGEKELTTDQLKQVAKATGVTQKGQADRRQRVDRHGNEREDGHKAHRG